MYKQPGKDIASGRRVLVRNESESNGETITNGQMPPNGHEYPRLAAVSCRRFSCHLKVVAALLTFCATVMLGSVAITHNNYSRWVTFRSSERTKIVASGPVTLRAVPPAERSVLPSSLSLDTLPRAGDIVNGDEVVERPPTLMFLHVWKCAGSSLRHLLRKWVLLEKQSIAIVVQCTDVVSEGERVCMQDHMLIDTEVQGARVRESQVVAGHFTWGFQHVVQQPYVIFTTLRNPLELFVSGQQFKNRDATKLGSMAASFVSEMMMITMQNHQERLDNATISLDDEGGLVLPKEHRPIVVGFIFRLVEPEVLNTKTLKEAAEEAIKNLDTFWLVGVVEQYEGFMAVLQSMMDPLKRHARLWEKYAVGKYNVSPNRAEKVLGAIDPDLVHKFNQTLAQQWDVYSHAVDLFQQRCRKMLPTQDLALCDVPPPASSYTLTDAERSKLRVQAVLGPG